MSLAVSVALPHASPHADPSPSFQPRKYEWGYITEESIDRSRRKHQDPFKITLMSRLEHYRKRGLDEDWYGC